MKDNGGSAFPSHGSMGEVSNEGMTLRDYFAAKALVTLLPIWEKDQNFDLYTRVWNTADGMLETRKP